MVKVGVLKFENLGQLNRVENLFLNPYGAKVDVIIQVKETMGKMNVEKALMPTKKVFTTMEWSKDGVTLELELQE